MITIELKESGQNFDYTVWRKLSQARSRRKGYAYRDQCKWSPAYTERWMVNGKPHNTKGPAITRVTHHGEKTEGYWINGEKISVKDYVGQRLWGC